MYNGICYEECPNNLNSRDYLCMDEQSDGFILIEKDLDFNYTKFVNSIDYYARLYSNEFLYTKRHVNIYKSKEYNSVIFKDSNCLNGLSLDFPKIDFGDYYTNIQEKNNINEELIEVISKKIIEESNQITSYSFYHPKTGDKLDTEICGNNTIKVIENLYSI